MTELKVGDKVKLKENLIAEEKYNGLRLSPVTLDFKGNILEIKKVRESTSCSSKIYQLKRNKDLTDRKGNTVIHHRFTRDMLRPVKSKVKRL